MSSATTPVMRPAFAWSTSASAAPPGVRKALTRTVESRTAHSGILLTQFFDDTGNFFFLLLRIPVTVGHLRMHAVQDLAHVLPCLLTLNHRDRLKQNPAFDRLGFQVIALFQVELLAQLRRERDL